MQTIDISNWTILSTRQASTNYISPDKKLFLKFYNSLGEEQVDFINKERDTSLAVAEMGIPTAKSLGIVKIANGGYGSLYENIYQKISFSRAISEDFSRMEPLIKVFADMGKKLHETPCNTQKFPSIKKVYLNALEENKAIYKEEDYQLIKSMISNTADVTTCIHGDFHPGNFITSPHGTYVIDLSSFAYGDPIFDWAHWYLLSNEIDEEEMQTIFHMSKEKIQACFKLSLDYTMEGRSEEEKSAFIKKCRKFASFTALLHAKENVFAREGLKANLHLLYD